MDKAIDLSDFLHGPGPDRAAVLADLDGCLISGTAVLPHVDRLFSRAADRLWIVSNNSGDTADTLSARLCGMGLSAAPERIVLAGEQALRRLARDMPGATLALFAAPPLQGLAARLGLRPATGAGADAVLLARDPDFRLSDLCRLVRLLHQGVPLHLANPDPSHPAPDGVPVPETGAMLAAVHAVLPGAVAHSLGKPAPDLIRLALDRALVVATDAVFIGDTDATDGVAARAAGVPFVLLRRPGPLPRGAVVWPEPAGVLSC